MITMLKNMKISMKLGLAFGFMALLLGMVAFVAKSGMNRIQAGLELIVEDRFPKTVMANNIIGQINLIARAQRNILLLSDPESVGKELKTIEAAEKIVTQEIEKLQKVIHSDHGKEVLRHVIDSREAYLPGLREVVKLGIEGKKAEATEVLFTRVRPTQLAYFQAVEEIIKYQTELMGEAGTAGEELEHKMSVLLLIVSGAALLLACGAGFLITRSITKPITRVVEGLTDGANQVASASAQVSSSSQFLAEGASEQAAGIEETSSSMEEMSSMTRQNAENARQANSLMAETSHVIEEANQSMGELNGSMREISVASEETAKIIKTIDEIAFQTNLLALNAAVEAARAGEAGAGFAVVADEVRSLAIRAADAAKNTADLIEGTVKKIKTGTDLVSKTNEAFTKVAAGARKVEELVGEITAASQEQAQGIQQINHAISEMDKVVQQNASGAEEAAAAAEEMNAQAEQMKGFVQELVAVVGGNTERCDQRSRKSKSQADSSRPPATASHRRPGFDSRKSLPKPAGARKGNGTELPGLHKSTEAHPAQVIPFNNDSLTDF
jgi:methyl-accepting chemotaxis protein